MRQPESQDTFFIPDFLPDIPWADAMSWPAKWISNPNSTQSPAVSVFRLKYKKAKNQKVTFHISADERYELYLDGKIIGRGPERSDPLHHCYETYCLTPTQDSHMIVAKVWSLEAMAPGAQLGTKHAFLCASDNEALNTGNGKWKVKTVDGLTFNNNASWPESCTGVRNIIDLNTYSSEIEYGKGEGWQKATVGLSALTQSGAGHNHSPPYLLPSQLPPQMNKPITTARVVAINQITKPQQAKKDQNDHKLIESFQRLLDYAQTIIIPPKASFWVLVDLGNYYCTYPELTLSDGAEGTLSIDFSESLSMEGNAAHTIPKGNRGEWDGKYWVEYHGDTVKTGGSKNQRVRPLWFRTGRWMALTVETHGEPLTIERLQLFETRYPLENKSSFTTSEPSFKKIEPMMFRTLQVCCHETFFDCPYYEQLMYLGDTRLQALLMYVHSGDSRLAKKALQLFDWSRSHQGLTQSCYPSRGKSTIAPFSLIWIAMLHDYSMWNSDPIFIKQSLPCLRSIVEYWETFRNSDNLIVSPPGWNFIDWSRPEGLNTFKKDTPRWGLVEVNDKKGVKWDIGVPPDGYQNGISGVLNLFYIYMLGFAIKLEQYAGEKDLATLYNRRQKSCYKAVHTHFYCTENGLYADNREKTFFSEHSQCLALLSGLPDDKSKKTITKNLFAPSIPLAETTFYFSHYYFETCRISGRIDKLLERQKRWNQFAKLGLKTVLEEPEPSRSDCHAWSSHPLFHWYATILGVRPAEPEFNTIIIKPQLGPLEFIKAELPIKGGVLKATIEKQGNTLKGSLILPTGLNGTLYLNEKVLQVQGGEEFNFRTFYS